MPSAEWHDKYRRDRDAEGTCKNRCGGAAIDRSWPCALPRSAGEPAGRRVPGKSSNEVDCSEEEGDRQSRICRNDKPIRSHGGADHKGSARNDSHKYAYAQKGKARPDNAPRRTDIAKRSAEDQRENEERHLPLFMPAPRASPVERAMAGRIVALAWGGKDEARQRQRNCRTDRYAEQRSDEPRKVLVFEMIHRRKFVLAKMRPTQAGSPAAWRKRHVIGGV